MKAKLFLLIFPLLFIPACSDTTDQANPMRVTVVDEQGHGIANVTVVIGNQSGVMDSHLTTNGVGEAHFASTPANATVTAASSCYLPSENRAYYHVDTTYNVNAAAFTVMLGSCTDDTRQVDVSVSEAIAGITSSEVTLGAITYGGTSVTMDVASGLQDDDTVSVFATGYGDAGDIRGYGVALDQPAANGTQIDVDINRTDLVQHSNSFVNVPATAMSYYAAASLIRKHGMTNLPFNFLYDSAPIPATVTTYAADDFSDHTMVGVTLMLDRDNDGISEAQVGFVRYQAQASDQVFDFNSAPAVPDALTYDQGTNGRPSISWTNRDPQSTVKTLTLNYRAAAPERKSFSYSMTIPASTTSLEFPELPEELAAYRPMAYDTLNLQTIKFDSQIHYADYLKALGSHSGRFYEAEGLENYSYATVSRLP